MSMMVFSVFGDTSLSATVPAVISLSVAKSSVRGTMSHVAVPSDTEFPAAVHAGSAAEEVPALVTRATVFVFMFGELTTSPTA